MTDRYEMLLAAITEDKVREMPYNPRWREVINLNGEAPERIFVKSGAQDAEHVF